jgi:hypothetical protein
VFAFNPVEDCVNRETRMKRFAGIAAVFAACAVMGTGISVQSAEEPPFGGAKSVATAKALWQALEAQKFVGADRINVQPFEGKQPHGAIQQVLSHALKLDDRTAKVIVKVNHGGEGASVASVYEDPNEYLRAYTVMYKMADGYDPAGKDWFWAKYDSDGALDKSPDGKPLAGRVVMCIACHKATGGDDLETLTK